MNTQTAIAAALASALVLSACSHKAPKILPPDPGGAVSTDTSAGTGAVTPGSQADFVAQLMGQDTVYFDTDQYNIDAADQQALAAQAAWLNKYPDKRATIQGHTDERGTREYNLALGERRANAAKNYLVSLGVDAARLTTQTFGKDQPVAMESTEEAWAKNRRAVTVTID